MRRSSLRFHSNRKMTGRYHIETLGNAAETDAVVQTRDVMAKFRNMSESRLALAMRRRAH